MDAKRKQQPQWQKVIVTCSGLCSSPVSVLGLETSQKEKICSFLTKLNSCPQTGNWNHSHTTGLFSLNRCSMYWIYSNTGFQEMPAVTHIKLSAIQRQCFHWQQPQSLGESEYSLYIFTPMCTHSETLNLGTYTLLQFRLKQRNPNQNINSD